MEHLPVTYFLRRGLLYERTRPSISAGEQPPVDLPPAGQGEGRALKTSVPLYLSVCV